jgi:hypothetical protein
MPDGSRPPILAEPQSRAGRTWPAGLGHKLLAGFLFVIGLIVCGLIALVSIAVALLVTMLNGLRSLKPRRGDQKKPAGGTTAEISEA